MRKIIFIGFVVFLILTGCKQNPSSDTEYSDDNQAMKKYCLEENGDSGWYSFMDDRVESETYGNYGWKKTTDDEIMVPAHYGFIYENCFDPRKQKGFAAASLEDWQSGTRRPTKKGASGIWYWKPTGEKIIESYNFDNGPDYFVSGVARFVENEKIGFMDEAFNKVIPAQFDWASPFEGDSATFCDGCQFVEETLGEHGQWIGGRWGEVTIKGEIKWTKE